MLAASEDAARRFRRESNVPFLFAPGHNGHRALWSFGAKICKQPTMMAAFSIRHFGALQPNAVNTAVVSFERSSVGATVTVNVYEIEFHQFQSSALKRDGGGTGEGRVKGLPYSS